MSTLAELAQTRAGLDDRATSHLTALVSEWGMLADFCFADLLLYLPLSDGSWFVAAQVRAATGQTLYPTDYVGSVASEREGALLDRCRETASVERGEIDVPETDATVNMMVIPVRHDGRVVAVLSREWLTDHARRPGQLETTYATIFAGLVEMVADGLFPFDGKVADAAVAPRVGDGVIVLDAEARVLYASPNAVSALHRVGIGTNTIGLGLAEVGFAEDAVRHAYERRTPVIEEIEQTSEVTLLTRTIPLLARRDGAVEVTGGVLLMRDVSELRKRDRLLLTKDATIREIHHRVKNNLQTISSLLRLQARRLTSEEAKGAVAESVRRIRTIALVHETLSREAGEDVEFVEIARPLVRLVEEGLQSADRPVSFRVVGDGGRLPADVATPLSVVILELLQNAVDHGFPEGSRGGHVVVALDHDDRRLRVRVVDDGRSLPEDFDMADSSGLGLSIVRTLVTTELAGVIEMRRPTPTECSELGLGLVDERGGAYVEVSVPLAGR